MQRALPYAPIMITQRNAPYLLERPWDSCVEAAASLRVPILGSGEQAQLSATVLRAALRNAPSPDQRLLARLETILLRATNRTRLEYLRSAKWWELEAQRGYASARRAVLYAQNMRWAAELVAIHGEGTWPELLARSGVKAPDIDKLLAEQESPKSRCSDPGHADPPEDWRTLNFYQRRELMGGANIPGAEGLRA